MADLNNRDAKITLSLGSISESTQARLDDDEATRRLETLAEEVKRSGVLKHYGFGWRWEGSKKDKLAFSARRVGSEVTGSLACSKGSATFKMHGRVEIQGVSGKINEGAIQRVVREEVSKVLRSAFAERSSISSSHAVHHIINSVLNMINKELAKQGAH